jgi:SAM-dependent methyltransferase
LLRARASGTAFTSVVTIGRQSLYLRSDEARALCDEFALSPDAEWARQAPGGVADDFFAHALGTTFLTAIDASGYEGAAIVHDMNTPIPRDLDQSFDAVIDGGSLEHIFNVAVALANLMRLARVGGRVFIGTPGNNLCGHGFYQFSPELMFRVFTEDRGFRLHDVAIFEYGQPDITMAPSTGAWKVADPMAAGQRVGLMSSHAAVLWVNAEKLAHRDDPLGAAPQQSDYVVRWSDPSATPSPASGLRDRLRRIAPAALTLAWRRYEQRHRFSTRNKKFYSRLL